MIMAWQRVLLLQKYFQKTNKNKREGRDGSV